jgi:phosphoribosylaminoimidazolecarboxamide formyltransferase/IMP cyclohydrolase
MKRALLSVSDKTGVVPFAHGLSTRGWELLSTGGTAKALRNAGLDVTNVSDVTGHPEMMEGRVKTLHPAIHAGLLARRAKAEDMAALEKHGYFPIDLVAVNLYPFRETIAEDGVTLDEAMEHVDIGGPTMLRAAAKSHRDVFVVVDPGDYDAVLAALDAATRPTFRRNLAAKAFRHVSAYDAAIAEYLGSDGPWEAFPERLLASLRRVQTLRYGENPDQEAAFYAYDRTAGLAALEQLHGKELSYNNLLDLDGALLCLSPFARTKRAAVCIIKHTTPCGLAVADSAAEAYQKALATDPRSAFGSVVALNREVDPVLAEMISELFVECVVAPGFSHEALTLLTEKKNVRILTYPSKNVAGFLEAWGKEPEPRLIRSVYGGVLAQTPSPSPRYDIKADWKVVTDRQPTDAEWDDLRFAWAAVFGVKSNAILLARDGAVLGIGAGQMSRVDSSKIAVMKALEAGHVLEGCALASDAFFPFRDGVDAAAAAGVRAIVQPGGSVRDEEVIAAANEQGVAMVFTGRRLFRH